MYKNRFAEFIPVTDHLFPYADRWNFRFELKMKAGHPHLRLLRRKHIHMVIAGMLPDNVSSRLAYWIVVGEIAVRPTSREDETTYNEYFREQDGVDWDANFAFCLFLAAQTLRNNAMQPILKKRNTKTRTLPVLDLTGRTFM